MQWPRGLTIGLMAISIGACAGRSPAPVAVVQPIDNSMSCTAVMAEVSSNNTKITELGSEKGAKVAQNVAAGVVGLVVWPVWFLMDFQGAAGTEIKALQDRNAYLATKANAMDCGKEPQTQVVTRQVPAPAPAYTPPAGPVHSPPPQPTYSSYPAHAVPAAAVPTFAPQGGFSQPASVTIPRYPAPTVEASAADPYAIDPYPGPPATAPGQITTPIH